MQVAWLTGTEEQHRQVPALLKQLHPELPVIAISEFAVQGARWIPYHPKRSFAENRQAIRESLRGEEVRAASILLVPRVPFWKLRAIALLVSGRRMTFYDRHLAPRALPWQLLRLGKAWGVWHCRLESPLRRWLRRVASSGGSAGTPCRRACKHHRKVSPPIAATALDPFRTSA